mmetsp:Transcript_21317/g.28566  ORF Transcript_21317/g.28566 Transcript_21317/m.28566 type:complete len:112 (-) Transcript_21317:291-626(-)|eukprot:CAMPEP_0185579468 /NCGR_PEP_ID=MMETSP0434-20130131/14883_1 /TAXON_ID=626734 ORGANISM="Favella taraikaensis, Strain Fe Narragansett Bay" /NCGR_SAMPLE_ID=MMETSP0434 /ASSEMBLY_ACC=CAM_ASM_000379 /LENGTH=111 /DNA_ID=CAMNT_0028197495 /DNA_START=20 /DNA_END=355 /DNA_ORIENTATION=+
MSETKHQPVRLYSKGVILGFKRSKVNQHCHTTLVKIEGLADKKDVPFYLGKRIAYIYRAKSLKKDSRMRVVWGRVTRAHGSGGVVKAKFARNIPPKAMGAPVRVMLYPSNV